MKNSDKCLLAILICSWFYLPMYAQLQGEVIQLHSSKFRWMVERNLDSLSMLLHPKLKYIHSNGWIESRKEVLENIRTGKLVYRQVDIDSTDVSISEKKAVIKGTGTFYVTLDGKDITIRLLYEEHYKKSRKGWLLYFRKSQKV